MNETQKIPRTQSTKSKAFPITDDELDFNVYFNMQAHLRTKAFVQLNYHGSYQIKKTKTKTKRIKQRAQGTQ